MQPSQSNLESFVKEKLEEHKRIVIMVKNHIDMIAYWLGTYNVDKNAYFSRILDLAHSIFLLWENRRDVGGGVWKGGEVAGNVHPGQERAGEADRGV